MTQIGDIIDGKYEILKQIGKGGMSVVYLAMDRKLNKQWAVKEISKRGKSKNNEIIVNSLITEANLMKRLDHPALPRIVDIIDNNLTLYVIMDYIEGESLDRILREEGAQPEKLVLDWAKQVCDVFIYLHSQKPPIIYRDMKPANIMVKPEGNIKVIDFGIAREYKEEGLADTTVLGTKGYASPEHYGQRQTDARSDIYTLGMTMHHLLTDVDPREPDYEYLPVRQYDSSISDGVEAIINKCTELDPLNRYQDCTELLYDLEHPDLITKEYKEQQRSKLKKFTRVAVMALLFLVISIGCGIASKSINNNSYDALTTLVASTSIDDKIESYKKAIEIYPDETDAYICMIEAYENEGHFSKQENDEFLALYNANKEKFDKSDLGYAELNYKTGMMYFNYYTDENGEKYFSTSIQKAYPFFEANNINSDISNDFEQKNLSDCYFQICNFYKRYILNTTNYEEASKSEYTHLLKNIKTNMKNVETMGAYDKISFYNCAFMLLHDQCSAMSDVKIRKKDVVNLMDEIYGKTKKVKTNKEQSKELQQEITDNYKDYRAMAIRAFGGEKEGK